MISLAEARRRMLGLAEPLEAVHVPLTEAIGLVLAEPLLADVDMPAFDRAAHDGYALRSHDAAEPGARLRLVDPPRVRRGRGAVPKAAELTLASGEAARLKSGGPLPFGADAVVRAEDTRPEPGFGLSGDVVVLTRVEAADGLTPRGLHLRAGTEIAKAGTRIRLQMVSLLAAQGCVHPVCHRRVRVAVLAVGDHLVGPAEAPVMHRERNAAGLAVVAPCLNWGATAHDLGVIPEAQLTQALDRALTAPVVVILSEPDGAVPRALKRAGVERVFDHEGIELDSRLSYGVVRDEAERVTNHVFWIAPGPFDVVPVVTLLLGPLIARLQGGKVDTETARHAVWDGPARAEDDLAGTLTVPVSLSTDSTARLVARPVELAGIDDLAGFATADALAFVPRKTGPLVEVVPLDAWPPRAWARPA